MENLNKELDRLAKSIVDRAEKINEGEEGSNYTRSSLIDDMNLRAANALAVIANTKALNKVIELFFKTKAKE